MYFCSRKFKVKHMRKMGIFRYLLASALVVCTLLCNAQLPLLTDNAGTVGARVGQVELGVGMGFQNEHRCIENQTEIAPVFTFGVLDKLDVVLGFPFVFSTVEEDSVLDRSAGFSDLCLELKYNFSTGKRWALAFKPGISLPTGNANRGLGSGKVSASAFLISSFDLSPVAINVNAGYLLNANRHGESMHIWHASLAADWNVRGPAHLVVNGGLERNPEAGSANLPAFAMLGLYYLVTEDCEMAVGYKSGLSTPEIDHGFVYGLTLRF